MKTLHFRVKKTDEIIKRNDREAAERQKTSLDNITEVVNELKETIEEKKFAKGEDEESVQEWATEIEKSLALADECKRKLSKLIAEFERELRDAETKREHRKLLELEDIKLEKRREAEEIARAENLEFEKKKWELEVEFKQKYQPNHMESSGATCSAVKMPKLVITKFNGTAQDWLRFWGQFEAQIDKSSVAAVTKFSYLKELVEPKVRKLIDGLPFTVDGYDKAKDLLNRRYGKTSDVIGAYVRNILELQTIRERNVKKIHEFYDTLLFNVESLQTLQSLYKLDAAVQFTMDKINVIKHELALMDENWSEWDFPKFVKMLEQWTVNNPISTISGEQRLKSFSNSSPRKEKMFLTGSTQSRGCFYCGDDRHKAINCDKVVLAKERKKILAEKRLCFNCCGMQHRAGECKSKATCQNCGAKHHTSICEKSQTREPGMTANLVGHSSVVHPVVVVKINGLKFRALLDSGASHSYASSTAINLIKAKPKSTSLRQIAMLTGVETRKMQVFDVVISSVKDDFQLPVNVTKVEKRELLTLENPKYKELLNKYTHLRDVEMDDICDDEQLPVHVIIGANDFAKIRTGERLRVGRRGDPVAEFTRFGWSIMSPGGEVDSVCNAYLAVTPTFDYERLCALDVLGLQDPPSGNQVDVYEEFKEQLTRSSDGYYETGLPWKGNCSELPNNYEGSVRRLNTLLRKLKRTDMLDEYDSVIREQLQDGVVEKAPAKAEGKEFYLPHRAVIREKAETTKMRIVYDASARARDSAPSLNECLHVGPPLNNQLWSVITRQRFHPVLMAGDLRRAFLQIRVRQSDRDALRFHWIKDKNSEEVETLRFTRVLFGLAPSPFLLNGVLQQHLELSQSKYSESVTEIRKSLYVDDLISGAPTIEKAKQLKQDAIEIFEDAKFMLHKWHSNEQELETNCCLTDNEQSFAKEQLSQSSKGECKLLGLTWDKTNDRLCVDFPTSPAETTKRGILTNLAKIYDPLGLTSPVVLQGKLLYREACSKKQAWDAPLPEKIAKEWRKWEHGLSNAVSLVRSIPAFQETIEEIQLHAFGDASIHGVCAGVYAVVTQASGVSQGLVTAKSRLAKEGLTIPRLELVAGHMAVNLVSNVRTALEGFPLATHAHCWLDSTVALHWINDNGEYRQFVANRVNKIQSHKQVRWHHVPTNDNPADLGSRGGSVSERELWWKGPTWLSDPANWPPEIVTEASPQSLAERKVQRELFAVGVEVTNDFDLLLERFGLRKAMRICAWVSRFTHNSRHPSEKVKGPLTTKEIVYQEELWIKRTQHQATITTKFTADREQLNLQLNANGVYECRGRIQGEYPIYLPDSFPFTVEVVRRAHETTLHGGVGLTMAKVRERFWVPRLRRLAKKIVKECWGCKRFQATAVNSQPPGYLPKERTEGTIPFNVIGADFAGPIKYRGKGREECKAYVVLYSCCLTRGVFLDVLPSLEANEFIRSLKYLIARRGRPTTVYSDNGSTFVAAAKWLKKVRNDERFHTFLCDQSITWRFNVSRAPWWGGHFERLIGLMKSAFYKAVGQGLLSWNELCEIILDVEVTLNNRPLCYMEDDAQFPTLTPNSLLFLNSNLLPELEPYHIEDRNLRKRAKFIKATKNAMWRRWTGEYLRALRERHCMKHDNKACNLACGDVVIIKSEERNRNKWPLGIVEQLYPGKDGVVRAAKIRAGRNYLERPIQHLYPLELSCDRDPKPRDAQSLNPNPTISRAKRDAAVVARLRVQNILAEDES